MAIEMTPEMRRDMRREIQRTFELVAAAYERTRKEYDQAHIAWSADIKGDQAKAHFYEVKTRLDELSSIRAHASYVLTLARIDAGISPLPSEADEL